MAYGKWWQSAAKKLAQYGMLPYPTGIILICIKGATMPSNDAKVSVRMPRNVHEALMVMADKERRSVNAQILVILEQAVKQQLAAPDSAAAS